MKTEAAPPKLFDSPECPEWRKGHYEHDWVCVISGINCRIDLGYGEWDAECDVDNSSHKTRAMAIKWLRTRIIAHRDALLKVAPVEMRPLPQPPKEMR
jgi:hypothetical protein